MPHSEGTVFKIHRTWGFPVARGPQTHTHPPPASDVWIPIQASLPLWLHLSRHWGTHPLWKVSFVRHRHLPPWNMFYKPSPAPPCSIISTGNSSHKSPGRTHKWVILATEASWLKEEDPLWAQWMVHDERMCLESLTQKHHLTQCLWFKPV